jgi:site-specific DNA-cytosine methylase
VWCVLEQGALQMRILVACEESQAVTKEFRALGHSAWSCDLKPCSGGHPEWHLQCDVNLILGEQWDMILAFPDCTHLAVSGARYFAEKRADGRQQAAIDFFMKFANHSCPRIAIENPVGIMSSVWRKPDQIIQPWMFGEDASKATCLWLKGLPKLTPTNIIRKERYANQTASGQNKLGPSPERARLRSKTYEGIARAMAEQWGKL